MDELWHFVTGLTGSVLFSEHLPLLRLNLLLLRLPPSVRPPLFTHISISLFTGRSRQAHRSRHVVILTAAPQAYILLLLAPMRTYVLFIYICIHIITYYFRAYIYIYVYIYVYMNTLPHARTHTHTLYFYMCTRIYTHNYTYII